MKKTMYGQFYTITNPFKNNMFFRWYNKIPNVDKIEILEPFAGANNIINLIEELNIQQPKGWKCYDIEPNNDNNKVMEYNIEYRDTINDFPKGYDIVITNPPYLAKNKATKLNIDFDNNYQDLYMKCLDILLKNVKYVAAIIPESFITANVFTERLYAVISLEMQMFDDTECPVCLALFVDKPTEDYYIVRNDEIVGKFNELKQYIGRYSTDTQWKFNDNAGNIGLRAVDNTTTASIEFVLPEKILNEIKVSSRAITKISGVDFKNKKQQTAFIEALNKNVNEYREATNDIFLTSFKGLRADMRYRRRLDYKTAKNILNKTYLEFYNEENKNIKKSI